MPLTDNGLVDRADGGAGTDVQRRTGEEREKFRFHDGRVWLGIWVVGRLDG